MTRFTNSIYSLIGYRRPTGSKQNMSASVYIDAYSNSLSTVGSPNNRYHRNVGNKVCEGLNSQMPSNIGSRPPRDLTASAIACGDRTSIVIRSPFMKGGSLECSPLVGACPSPPSRGRGMPRFFHSSNVNNVSSKPGKREGVSVGA